MKFFIISSFSILLSAEVTSIYKIDGMMCAVNCPKIIYDSICKEIRNVVIKKLVLCQFLFVDFVGYCIKMQKMC